MVVRRRAAVCCSGMMALALLGGCGASPKAAGPSSPPTAPTSAPQSTPAPSRSASPTPKPSKKPTRTPRPATVTKLVVLVVENHSIDQMRADMPFLASIADRYGYADDYTAITHPSLPNYLAITGGSTFGVSDDGPPSEHSVHGSSVFGQALASGQTAGLYAEGMASNCDSDNTGDRYAVKHNPWAYFVDEHGECQRYDVPLTSLAHDAAAGRLPSAGMVIPNLCNDAHDCSLGTADAWLRDRIGTLTSGPDWRSGRLAIVVTADEDDEHSGNHVLTVVLHPSLHHVVVHTPLSHYSLTRLYDEVLGEPLLGQAAKARSMATAFGLPVAAR